MIDRDAAQAAATDVPFDTVVAVLTTYLAGRKLERDYAPFLEQLAQVRTGVEVQAGGRVAQQFESLLAEITSLVDENIRCQQMAKDAMVLSQRVNAVVDEREAAFIDQVKQVLQKYLDSGTVGMRALAQEFLDSMHAVRSKT